VLAHHVPPRSKRHLIVEFVVRIDFLFLRHHVADVRRIASRGQRREEVRLRRSRGGIGAIAKLVRQYAKHRKRHPDDNSPLSFISGK